MYDVMVKYVGSYIAKLWAKYYNLEQNIVHNRLGKKELPERKIGGKAK